MGVHKSPWAADLFLEANKFWFHSIRISWGLGVVQLLQLDSAPKVSEKKDDEGKAERERKECTTKRGKIVKLIIDMCDIFIPGAATGWIVVSSASVGMASVVSSVLAGMDIWERVQNSRF